MYKPNPLKSNPRSSKTANCQIDLSMLPFLLGQQVESLATPSKKSIFSFSEACLLFLLATLKKGICHANLADEFILLFLQVKYFFQENLPHLFSKLVHTFEIFFVFEFLVKNFGKISKKKIPMLAQNLFRERADHGLYYFEGKEDMGLSRLNQNEISKIINLKSSKYEDNDISGSFASSRDNSKIRESRFHSRSLEFIYKEGMLLIIGHATDK